MGVRGVVLAIEAGMCAAMASVTAKLAVSSDSAFKLATSFCYLLEYSFQFHTCSAQQVTVAIRLASVLGIFLFNALMWVLFTKSMHECSSTLEATAFNLSSNFITTAILGKLLFGEHLNLMWYIGSLLIIVGLTVLHTSPDTDKDKTTTTTTESKEQDHGCKKHL